MMNAKPKPGLIVLEGRCTEWHEILTSFMPCVTSVCATEELCQSVVKKTCFYAGLLPVPEQWHESFHIVYVLDVSVTETQCVSLKLKSLPLCRASAGAREVE